MNALQRLVLLVGIVAVVGMGTYPPWRETWEHASGYPGVTTVRNSWPAGYSLITQPPSPVHYKQGGLQMDATKLAVQEAIAVIATGMGVLLVSSRKSNRAASSCDAQ